MRGRGKGSSLRRGKEEGKRDITE